MSIFIFDDDTLQLIRYLLSIHHFKEYQIGPSCLTTQLCALAFEKMLVHTALRYPKFQKTKSGELSLEEIIRFLQKNNLVTSEVGSQLQDFLAACNSIICGSYKKSADGYEILQFLCTQANVKVDREIKNKTFNEIINRKLNSPREDCIPVETDFDDLNVLYPKCFVLQQQIQKRLTTPLRAAQSSFFTPNSGGIWLPFVTKENQSFRVPVDGASLGVALTPLGLRIGLNFGCHAYDARIRYYELLSNGELTDILGDLNSKGSGYCLCDTFWHYYVRNIQSLQWCLTLYGSTKVTLERAVEETKQQQGSPLTGHKYLVSKVIERRPEDFTYIVQGMVNEAAKVLDELYPVLKKIDILPE